jgi:ribosome-associated protein
MIAAAHMAPTKRKATRPSRAAKDQRVEQKRQRSEVKKARGRVDLD